MSGSTVVRLALLCTLATRINAACNCAVSSGQLSCTPGTINAFPEDLADCPIDHDDVTSIQLLIQPITQVGDRAFSSFPNVHAIALAMNERLSELSETAFEGLTGLRGLFLQANNISHVPRGMLDSLIALNELDLDLNPINSSYETKAWHLCDRLGQSVEGLNINGNLIIQKDLEINDLSDEYCQVRRLTDPSSHKVQECGEQTQEGVLTCLGTNNIAKLACQIQDYPDNSSVLFEFKTDGYKSSRTRIVEDFAECETNEFFRSFNNDPDEYSEMRLMKTLTLYSPKYDLVNLADVTGSYTEKVTIHADTVFLSSPFAQPLNHMLKIRARRVILDQPIPMLLPKPMFALDGSGNFAIEPFAQAEEHIVINANLTLRWRKYGFVDILDELPAPGEEITGVCNPNVVMADASLLDTSDWFDVTAINLKYACARTLLSTQSNNNLVSYMSRFSLDYASNRSIISDVAAFTASSKFSRVLELVERPFIHNVPTYSIGVISAMADALRSFMDAYYITEQNTEMQINMANAKLLEMDASFAIVEATQEAYFQTELAILDAIFHAVNTSWEWSFDHREGFKETMQNNLATALELMMSLRAQEYQMMLAEASAAVEHMEGVVSKYEEDVGRHLERAQASMQLQQKQMQDLRNKTDAMSVEVDAFERHVEEYKERLKAKLCLGIFGGLLKIGIGAGHGLFSPRDFSTDISLIVDGLSGAVGSTFTYTNLMNSMAESQYILADMDRLIADLELGDLGEMSLNMSTAFSSALRTAYELKDKAADFDSIQVISDEELRHLDIETNYEIEDMDKLMASCTEFTTSAHRLIDETSVFADYMLLLAEKNGDLQLAWRDLERAVAQVENINQTISNLEAAQENYTTTMHDREIAYEAAVEDLKGNFTTAIQEELDALKATIIATFEDFKKTFDTVRSSYRRQMSDLVISVKQKRYGLKEYSMTQRSMLLTLFVDYCDAKFYHSFSACSIAEAPMMTDDFQHLLDKLSQLQWSSLTDSDPQGFPPQEFGRPTPLQFTISDNASSWSYPVQTLRTQGHVDLNLRQLDTLGYRYFQQYWRVRIDRIVMILLDADGDVLPSPGQNAGQEIRVQVTFPKVFNDTDYERKEVLFLGQGHICRSDYITVEGAAHFQTTCEIAEEFSDSVFKPSEDGIFNFKLGNPEMLDVDRLDSIKIQLSGKYIPFPLLHANVTVNDSV